MSLNGDQAFGKPADRAVFLEEWISAPYVQEPVIAALKAAEWPLTLREVAEAAHVRLRPANRVLGRLCAKRMVTRYKLPMQRHAFCRKRWICIPNAARRLLYVYRWNPDQIDT